MSLLEKNSQKITTTTEPGLWGISAKQDQVISPERFIVEAQPLETIDQYRNIPNIDNRFSPTAVITSTGGRLIFLKNTYTILGNTAFHELDSADTAKIIDTIRKPSVDTVNGTLSVLEGIRTDQIRNWNGVISGDSEKKSNSYLVNLSPLTINDGQFARRDMLLNIQRIITEQELHKTLAEKDEEIRKLKSGKTSLDHLSSLIAHDLKSPLTVMKGNAQLILRDLEKNSTDTERMIKSAKAIVQASITQEDMLDEALTEVVNTREAKFNLISASDLFTVAVGKTEKLEETDDELTIAYLCPAEQVVLMLDIRKILHSLLIYINNANQVGAKLIVVRGEVAYGNKYVISVKDDGPGMTPEQLNKCIIDGYSTKGGSGIGLGMAKKNIEDCGGEVLPIISEPGKGSTFSFVLPIQAIIK